MSAEERWVLENADVGIRLTRTEQDHDSNVGMITAPIEVVLLGGDSQELISVTNSLFRRNEFEASPTLATLRQSLESIPHSRLLDSLRRCSSIPLRSERPGSVDPTCPPGPGERGPDGSRGSTPVRSASSRDVPPPGSGRSRGSSDRPHATSPIHFPSERSRRAIR